MQQIYEYSSWDQIISEQNGIYDSTIGQDKGWDQYESEWIESIERFFKIPDKYIKHISINITTIGG